VNIQMDIIRHPTPLRADVSNLIAQVFGMKQLEEDRKLLEGNESGDNLEMLFSAQEGESLIAFCRITISRAMPWTAMLGDVCVAPESRGSGIGRKILCHAISEAERLGVEAIWLGTNNPVAARLYDSVGFRFVTGSNVMLILLFSPQFQMSSH